MNNNLTPKESAVLEEQKEFFLDGGVACVACLVEEHWDVALVDWMTNKFKFTNRYLVYKAKQNRIINRLYTYFKTLDAKDYPVFEKRAKFGDTLWLLTVSRCGQHPMYSVYKLLNSAVDFELVDNKARTRIESISQAKQLRYDQAMRQYPRVFKPRIKRLQMDIPYILPRETKAK